MPRLRNSNARPDMVAYPHPSLVSRNARENVKSCLEPGCPPMGNLDRFMPGAVRWQHTSYFVPCSRNRVVVVQFYHRAARGDGFRSVNLYLVVVLSSGGRDCCDEQKRS